MLALVNNAHSFALSEKKKKLDKDPDYSLFSCEIVFFFYRVQLRSGTFSM